MALYLNLTLKIMIYLTFCDAYFYWRDLRNEGFTVLAFGDWLARQDHRARVGLYGVVERRF